MEHECVRCETTFESKSKLAKYCPECRKLSPAKRKQPVEVVAPVAVPEYVAPDVVPLPAPKVEMAPAPVANPQGRQVCKNCGMEYTSTRGKGNCPMCALERHFGTLRR